MPSSVYFPSYIDTYVERDVVGLLDVRNKAEFHKFLSIIAQSVGALINISSLSRDTGVNVSTIKSWLSILEQSYLTFSLQPYYANAQKRLTKTPKLYFYDTGLLCYLLKIGSLEQLLESPYLGPFSKTSSFPKRRRAISTWARIPSCISIGTTASVKSICSTVQTQGVPRLSK